MTHPPRIRLLTCDDHSLIRAGLLAVIGAEPDMEVVGEAGDGAEAVEQYRRLRPDVVLMDLRMPEMDGIQAMRAIVSEFPEARIVALTTYGGDEDIYQALDAGAKGYLLKDMLRTRVLGVIRTVHGGRRAIPPEVAARLAEYTPRTELTERELEVLALIAEGMSNKQIARALGRTEGTVKIHVLHLLRKLGAGDRTQAVTTALRRGIIRLNP